MNNHFQLTNVYHVHVEGPPGHQRCDAILLTPLIALVTAQCLVGISPRIAQVSFSFDKFKNSSRVSPVKNIAFHNDFNNISLENNLALLFLEKNLTSIVPFPRANTEEPVKLEQLLTINSSVAAQLPGTQDSVSIISLNDCGRRLGGVNISDKHVCTEAISTNGTCLGNLTGLFISCTSKGEAFQKHICGIFSWGRGRGCDTGLPAVHVKLMTYEHWILSTIAAYRNKMSLCKSSEFRCNTTKTCILSSLTCNGVKDCGEMDTSDEENCFHSCHKKCPQGTKRCETISKCYGMEEICDGIEDCEEVGRSDEGHCTRNFEALGDCNWNYFRCKDGSKCVKGSGKCDGKKDCSDGSDEENCEDPGKACHWTQFFCLKNASQTCIPRHFRCDGKNQCEDGSDEAHCDQPPCHWSEFQCFDKKNCIEGHLTCDRKYDCDDGSDEKICNHAATGLFFGFAYLPFVIIILLAVSVTIVCVKYRKQRAYLSAIEIKLFREGDVSKLKEDQYAHQNAQFIPYNRSYEIKYSDILILEEEKLGEGAFGVVYKGRVASNPDVPIAIKTTKSNVDKSVFLALLSELKVMIHLGPHKNIVALLGACTEFLEKGRAYILVEFCPMGSLESYLRTLAYDQNPVYTNTSNGLEMSAINQQPIFTIKDFLHWAIQIADGMQYLELKKVIHGDLATRNVLLDSSSTAKITDFGLSSQLLNYEDYVKKSGEKLPWRWLALETLKTLVFTHKSDVWSYGVTLWEIFSLGLVPYTGTTWTVDFVDQLDQNMRLLQPKYATHEIYKIMVTCWHPHPKTRPDFQELSQMLENILQDCIED